MATAVERAKQVTMTELNAIIGVRYKTYINNNIKMFSLANACWVVKTNVKKYYLFDFLAYFLLLLFPHQHYCLNRSVYTCIRTARGVKHNFTSDIHWDKRHTHTTAPVRLGFLFCVKKPKFVFAYCRHFQNVLI